MIRWLATFLKYLFFGENEDKKAKERDIRKLKEFRDDDILRGLPRRDNEAGIRREEGPEVEDSGEREGTTDV